LPQLFGKLIEFLDYFEPKIDEYNDLLSFNHFHQAHEQRRLC